MLAQEDVVPQPDALEDAVPDDPEGRAPGEGAQRLVQTGTGCEQVVGIVGREAEIRRPPALFRQDEPLPDILAQLAADGLLIEHEAVPHRHRLGQLPQGLRLAVGQQVEEEEVQADVVVREALGAIGLVERILGDAAAVHRDGDLPPLDRIVMPHIPVEPALHPAPLVVIGARAPAHELAPPLEAADQEVAHEIACFLEMSEQLHITAHEDSFPDLPDGHDRRGMFAAFFT